jgi:uncharacterized protein YqgC (DUF456 family)
MTGFVVAGAVLLLAGLVGCVLPILPGPPLAYLSLLMISVATSWQAYRPGLLIGLGILALVVTALDYVFPALASRRYGASKAGVWGSVAGMLVGLIFFPPFGVIVGALAGAVLGEYAFGPSRENALRAGWGVFLGILVGIGAKLAYTGVVAYFFIRAIPW